MRIIAPAIAVSLVLLLTACDPGGSGPVPTATPEPTESTTVEPVVDEDTEPQAATILFRTESFAILDEDDATMDEFDYFDSPAEAIAALTEAFGGAPVITTFEGHTHQWPGSNYTWDAFTLIDYDGPSIAYGEDYDVSTSASVVRGLAIETVGGITIGSTAAAGIATGGFVVDYSAESAGSVWLQLDIVASTDPEWAGVEGGPRIFVYGGLTGPDGTITTLSAPAANYGP
jgi:hypothetical protein